MNKKVRIECWWTSTEQITKRAIDQFCTNSEDIDLVTDNTYDWLVVCGKLNKNFNMPINRSKTIFFVMEPSWSPNTDIRATDYSKYICTHNVNIFTNKIDSIFFEEPNFMFYGGRGDDGWTIDNLNRMTFDKTKNISMVVTKRGNCWNADNIYNQRVELAEELITYDDIDIYGTFWEKNNKNIHGEIWTKFIALQNYKFSIGIENTSENNYITEKFYDCILTDTIPIYYGAPNIGEYFDIDGIINLSNINNKNLCINKILDTLSDADNIYRNKINACVENKKRFFKDHNIINKIKKIIYNE